MEYLVRLLTLSLEGSVLHNGSVQRNKSSDGWGESTVTKRTGR